MGWIADLLGVGAQTALGYGNLAYQMQRDSGLTGAEREANAFSAQQAEIARDWQENFYNQYESPQAMIRQAQEAGINPAAIFGNAMGGSAPSASAPTSVTPKGGDVGGAVAQLANLSKMIAEIDYIKAGTEERKSNVTVNAAMVRNYDALTDKAVKDVEYIQQMIEESKSNISVNEVEKALKEAQKLLYGKQGDLLDAEIFYEEWRNAYIAEEGVTPEIKAQRQAAWIQVSGMAANALINQAGSFLTAKYAPASQIMGEKTVSVVDPTTGEVKSLLNEIFKQTKL